MKQRIAIVALLLTVIGGYLWWQGRPADGSILYGNVDIRDVNLAFGSAAGSIRCWSMRGIA
jgi:HlyD family secretion protein